ncbi:TIGR02253 family HAD-type hydrolase [Thermococcus sp. Bubb.Bath]|uniref:TIGR02253 family HAD-type hydrolase n=1 Tax=Thermococcus sp. Bubb.Bath TaxID=1638242 RepID=UPI00143A4380|nr:TIGR02253 family HAD-type hydrolase [Thermococcus sp. Bubb.Bath]NJF24497.1 TIGR02253 family HAD-type hydrolase [Thermococcus sp. Bubb.Bath]
MVKAILFDIDHTLLTEEPLMMLFLPQVYEKLAKKRGINKEEARNIFLNEIMERRDSYEWHDWNFFFDLFELDMKYEDILRGYPHKLHVYSDVPPVLEWLREEGYSLGVVTSGPEYQRLKLELTGLSKYFDVVVTREDAGTVKPDPKMFLLALEALGAEPSEAVMVGDSPWQDVYGAKNVGMTSVWIDRKGEHDIHLADFKIHTLYELRKVLEVVG